MKCMKAVLSVAAAVLMCATECPAARVTVLPLIDRERQFAAEFRRHLGETREVDLGIVCFDETEVFLFELHAHFADREVNVIVRVVGKLTAALSIAADQE